MQRIRACGECRREIQVGLTEWSGTGELVEQAAEAEEGFMPLTGGEATVVLSCSCSHVEVELAPGSVSSAWDMPESWHPEESGA